MRAEEQKGKTVGCCFFCFSLRQWLVKADSSTQQKEADNQTAASPQTSHLFYDKLPADVCCMMAAADEALEQMYSWIEQKELSAKKLQKVADELEALRDKCNMFVVAGSTTAVVGFVSVMAVVVAMLSTGGLAAPGLVIAGLMCSGVGTAITLGTKITKHISSSSTLKEATKIEKKCNRKAEKLQQLFEELKAQSTFTDPDQNDQYVLKELLEAMARRSGLTDINPSFLLDDHSFNFGGQHTSVDASPVLKMPTIAEFVCVLSFFSCEPSGKNLNLLLATGSMKLTQKLSAIGLKTAVKGGAMVVGGALGLVFSLPEEIESWKKLTTKSHVTKASESLRKTAESLLNATQAMKHELNEVEKTFDRLRKVKLCIENPQRTLADKATLINFAIDLCNNEEFKQWLRENSESEAFFICVDIFNLVEKEIKKYDEAEKKKKKIPEGEIDVVFVAHGLITEALISPSYFLSRSINDVLLYSPWNCLINSYTAYGIASGRILPQHREFYCRDNRSLTRHNRCLIPDSGHQPTRLPNDWNRMTNARDGSIPNIMVRSFEKPSDGAWEAFTFLRDAFGIPDTRRVIIPFMLPGNVEVTLPFFMVTLALSVVLSLTNLKATVHLSACLEKISEDTELDVNFLISQYSYTIDKTFMSCSPDVFDTEDQETYRLLRVVFD
ncbi:uncharacterized protein LOC115413241 [Sphaeramia orbicularis]|uniref:uncharacterized protein LOC115413241 n=1 Tax=Sphaeramia orbicularis TaxID=375764 RepID=UPI00117CC937|nr:uncharacterized protein LOC115413241 [Sphaeramia orbicularis]